ncbi:signal peptidase II [Candidatus Parcubacteria bacterium]|nr:signal peptidase II [Candidatus Parcubacteria bacterium]
MKIFFQNNIQKVFFKIVTIFGLAIFFVVIDRLLKSIAIVDKSEFSIIGDWIGFRFVENYNIAFSLPLGGLFLNILVVIILLCLIIFAIDLSIKKQTVKLFLISNVILGAASNLYDRFRYGFVIDYLDVKYFTVLNVADIMISVGLIILAIILLREEKVEEQIF